MSVKGKRNLERIDTRGKSPYRVLMDIQMTPNKQRILEFIYEMRFAKTSQIHEAIFPHRHIRRTKDDLSQMYRDLLLHRVFPVVNRGSSEAVYMLGHLGRYAIAAQEELESVQSVKWDERDNTVGIEKKEHTLAITEIRVRIEAALRSIESIQLGRFYGERQVGRMKFTTKSIYEETIDQELNPDAYIEIISKARQTMKLFFLEYDTGKESKAKIEEKINRYCEFYMSKEFPYKSTPTVLIISQKNLALSKFEEAARESIEKFTGKGVLRKPKFYGCHEEIFLADPLGKIFFNLEDRLQIISIVE